MASIFEGIGQAKASVGANYIRPSDYIVRIDRVKQDVSHKKIPFVAFELTILKVLLEREMTINESGEKRACPHKPGEQVSQLIMMNHEMALPNLKAIVMALFGCDEEAVNAEICDQMVSDAQPMAGMVAKVECVEIITKGKKEPFTKPIYRYALTREDCAKEGIEVTNDMTFIG